MKISDEKLGNDLLKLYRKQREFTYLTLEGRKVEPNPYAHRMYNYYAKEIDILSQTISGRNKTAIRKECKEKGWDVPDFTKHISLPTVL